MNAKKGYKVADVKRQKKIGVAAENLDELIEKSCKKLKFNVSCAECRLFVAEDGTQVDDDDYLATLPPQTLFILVKNKESMVTEPIFTQLCPWDMLAYRSAFTVNIVLNCFSKLPDPNPKKEDFDYYYNLIRSTKGEFLNSGNAAKEFLSTNLKEKLKVFQKYIAAADNSKTMLSERAQDPSWFEGLEPSEKVKEQSMSKRVKERMRGYYYKTKSALQSSDLYVHSKNGRGKNLIDQFLSELKDILESNKYNEGYFNRSFEKDIRLCDETGEFNCGGLWCNTKCNYDGEHVINPYRSREERIIFQTWNLDHRIELSRSVIPKILEAINGLHKEIITCISCENHISGGNIHTYRYYLEIFTRENLKLVHIVCHHKGKHSAESNVYVECESCFRKPDIQAKKAYRN